MAWAILVPAAWLIVAFGVQRYRRGSKGLTERNTLRSRLPGSVSQLEFYLVVVLLPGLTLVLYIGLAALHAVWHPGVRQPSQPAIVLMGLSAAIGALVPALLLANLLSWLTPFSRRANLLASDGLPTMGYRAANLALGKVGAVVVPIALIQGLVGSLNPWVL